MFEAFQYLIGARSYIIDVSLICNNYFSWELSRQYYVMIIGGHLWILLNQAAMEMLIIGIQHIVECFWPNRRNEPEGHSGVILVSSAVSC